MKRIHYENILLTREKRFYFKQLLDFENEIKIMFQSYKRRYQILNIFIIISTNQLFKIHKTKTS